VIDRFGFLSRIRLGRRQLAAGAVFLAVLSFSLAIFFLAGDRRAKRVLFFPAEKAVGLVAEQRFLPNRGGWRGTLKSWSTASSWGP
jgi:hypothetical protein